MTKTPKSQSEWDGEDFVQSSGSPHNSMPDDAPLKAARGFDVRCPQCGGPCDVREWGTVCLRENCRTVLDDQHSGRFSGKPETRTWLCCGCGEETSRRVISGEPKLYMAICQVCDAAVQALKGQAA